MNPTQPRQRSRHRRVWLVLLGVLILAACLFHPVENWRGRRAWEQTKLELEARGEKLASKDFIPAAIPDEQNRMAHPFMRQFFGTNAVQLGISHPRINGLEGIPFFMSELQDLPLEIVVPSMLPRPPKTPHAVETEEEGNVSIKSTPLRDALIWMARSAELKIVIQDDNKPPFTDLWGRPTLVTGRWENSPVVEVLEQLLTNHQLEARFDQTNQVFRIQAIKPTLAQVFTNFDSLNEPLKQFDEAMQRPLAAFVHHIDRDLPNTWPNYVNQRALAQCLASRAKVQALLGHREDMLKDLHRLRALRDVANARQPTTIIGAMSRTAIAGLFADTVQELMAAKLLAPEDCGSIQGSLAGVDLLGPVLTGLRVDRATGLEWLDRHAADPAFIVNQPNPWGVVAAPAPIMANATLTAQILAQARNTIQNIAPDATAGRRFFAWLSPRGWVDQNKALAARLIQRQLEGLDPVNHRVDSRRTDDQRTELEADTEGTITPYNYLAQLVTGNFTKASQTCARNQTLLNEAFVACALERFRAANNRYPETLNELVPRFADRLPHDLFDGQPLRYQRNGNGYLLYSIGWNAKDDGGQMKPKITKWDSYYFRWSETEGDWVWLGVPKQ